MNQSTHIIDPDGEVIIILRHANSPFAQPDETIVAGMVSHTLLPKFWDVVQRPAKVFNFLTILIEEPAPDVAGEPATELVNDPAPEKMLTGCWEESINYLQRGLVKIPIIYKEDVPTIYCRDLILWLWVSWYFQLPSYNLGLPIPGYIITLMNVSRVEAINKLECNFTCSLAMYGALTKQMHVNALLLPRPVAPFPNITYEHLVRKILLFKSPVWYSRHSKAAHTCSSSSLRILIGEFNDYIKGLDSF
ncbi:uncharacterized protein BDV14DRAFT_193960 [Aspergillus stella-maris]|uniref:uncharacterized protein n=1 Tax=Aspergillus stella-maris TaxID=1810926 RepID=UPI003CCDEBB9